MEFQYPNEWDFMEGIDAFPAYIYKTKFNFNFLARVLFLGEI